MAARAENPHKPAPPPTARMTPKSPTGIKVIVIGAGFAGLGMAIECIRQGHEVEVFEQARQFTTLGDLIVLTPNGSRIVSRWDDCLPRLMNHCLWVDRMNILDRYGKQLHVQPWVREHDGFPFTMGQRSAYQEIFVGYAESLGIPVHMNSRVEQHFENETGAGIVVNGVTYHADVVIGTDGIHSRCRVHVTGREEEAQGSGYAVFRAWFNLDEVTDPLINELRRGESEDSYDLWIGDDVHAFILTCPALNMVVYAFTHADTFNAKESYSHPGRIDDVLQS
ncbi:hypothetical protein BDV06DRAFT_227491, partial [Aspergillus oleicola]